jgi:hypothetical protein
MKKSVEQITQQQCLDYEIHSSSWASWISNSFLQEIIGKYFAWKVRRKFNNYMVSKMNEAYVKDKL